jgi:hypothetical protein
VASLENGKKRHEYSQGKCSMPKMSDQRRKRIQARQRKLKNALNRTTKAAKRAQRNTKKATRTA